MRRWPTLASALLIATGGIAGSLGSTAWAANAPAPKASPHQVASHATFKAGTKQVVRLDPTYTGVQPHAQARLAQPFIAPHGEDQRHVHRFLGRPPRPRSRLRWTSGRPRSTARCRSTSLLTGRTSPAVRRPEHPRRRRPNDVRGELHQRACAERLLPGRAGQRDRRLRPAAGATSATPTRSSPTPAAPRSPRRSTALKRTGTTGSTATPGPGQVDLRKRRAARTRPRPRLRRAATTASTPSTGNDTGHGYYGLSGDGQNPTIFDTFASDGSGTSADVVRERHTAPRQRPARRRQRRALERDQRCGRQRRHPAAALLARPLVPFPSSSGKRAAASRTWTRPPTRLNSGRNPNALMTPALTAGEVEHLRRSDRARHVPGHGLADERRARGDDHRRLPRRHAVTG